MKLIHLFDDKKVLSELRVDTIDLIHCTNTINAIKKLTYAYEIINLNLEVRKRFPDEDNWDICSISDLKRTKAELLIYHHTDFKPRNKLVMYGKKITNLVQNIEFKLSG